MHGNGLDDISRRIRRAFRISAQDFLGFDDSRQIRWGYETRRAGSPYSWDGMRRGNSPKRPHVLFQYTLEGRGEYWEGGENFSQTQGQGFTVILPSAHRYFLPADSEQWTFFWMMIRHPFLTERVRDLRRREPAVQTWNRVTAGLESAVVLFEHLCGGQFDNVWDLEKYLFAWLLESERERHHGRYPENARRKVLDETRQFILARLERTPSVTDLAEVHRLERTTFSRHFKTNTGLSPAVFVTKVRLEEALKLLRTSAKLEEVAARTGFADANHFCKVFRKNFHSSPGSYRRLILKI